MSEAWFITGWLIRVGRNETGKDSRKQYDEKLQMWQWWKYVKVLDKLGIGLQD